MSYLNIPLDELQWSDIPSDLLKSGKAIVILALREMPYAEYLQTNHWQEMRRKRLEHDRHRCVICPATDVPLHVHHLDYSRRGFEELEDLRTLCCACHGTVHAVGLHQIRAQVRQELEDRDEN